MNPLLVRASVPKSVTKISLITMSILIGLPVAGVFALTHVKTQAQADSVYNATSYPGDFYAWGNCTWWASIRRSQTGHPIPNTWGNAATWAERAAADGYAVDHTPTPGSIMQISNVDGGLGHVAFVESVDPDGTWHISEMNVKGLDVVDDKALPASDAANFNFIHFLGHQ
ncbi:MAG: CHAP domain-containing protein [Candidatus Saccharimonadales bacterium]